MRSSQPAMRRSERSPARNPGMSRTGAPSPRGPPSPRSTGPRAGAARSAATRLSPQSGMRRWLTVPMAALCPPRRPPDAHAGAMDLHLERELAAILLGLGEPGDAHAEQADGLRRGVVAQ